MLFACYWLFSVFTIFLSFHSSGSCTLVVGDELAYSVGASLMLLRPVSVFMDDAVPQSFWSWIVYYLYLAGGLLPFCLTIGCSFYARSEVVLMIRGAVYFAFVVVGVWCMTPDGAGIFDFILPCLAVVSGIMTAEVFQKLWQPRHASPRTKVGTE
jgi:hypothetical protein